MVQCLSEGEGARDREPGLVLLLVVVVVAGWSSSSATMADPPKLATAVTDYARLDPAGLAQSPIPLKLAHGPSAPPRPHLPIPLTHPHSLHAGVVNGDYRLIELVKALADTLTSEDDARRARGPPPSLGSPHRSRSAADPSPPLPAGVSLLSAVVVKLVDLDSAALDRQISASPLSLSLAPCRASH